MDVDTNITFLSFPEFIMQISLIVLISIIKMLIFANQTAPGYSKYFFTEFKQVRNIDPDNKMNI